MAKKAVINVEVLTDEEAVEDLNDELEESEAQVRDTAESISEVGDQAQGSSRSVKSLSRSLRRLDGTDVDVDVDSGTTRRLPGELDEVQEALRFIGSLRPEVLATAGAVGALTGSLAAAGGLSAAALVAASKTGVLEDELAGLKAEGKSTARHFAQEFKPVLEQDVLPALRSLLGIVRRSSDELADFSAGVFDTLRKLKQLKESGPLGRALFGGPFAAIPGDQPFVPDQFGLGSLLDVIPKKDAGSGRGPAARLENTIRSVERELETARERFATMRIFDIEKEKVVQDRISTLEELRKKLIETRAEVDLKKAPSKWRELDALIQEINRGLKQARGNLQKIKIEQQVGGLQPASKVEPAGAAASGSLSENLSENIRTAELAGSARELGRQVSQAGEQLEKDVNRQLVRGIQLAGQLGATLVQSAKQGGASFQQIFGSILQTVGSVVGVANPPLGAGIAGTGTIVKQLQHGGEVHGPGTATSDSIPVRLSDGEFVVNAGSAQQAPRLLQAVNESPSLAARMNTLFTREARPKRAALPSKRASEAVASEQLARITAAVQENTRRLEEATRKGLTLDPYEVAGQIDTIKAEKEAFSTT
jgi:hypothetical protein